MVNDILGRNIRKYRLAQNWTQEKLADVLCVSHQVISKWENAIALPDIETLCSLTQVFGISLDELCGITPEKADLIVEEMEKSLQDDQSTYSSLYSQWTAIEKQLTGYPTNDNLLFAALRFLRTAHDKIETDTQKDEVNVHILKIAERILDFSRNDSYRSCAHYNLALYYSEQVNIRRNNAQDKINAEKAKIPADLVLYKDMHKTFYHSFGTTNVEEYRMAKEKTLIELIEASKRACNNLIRCYQNLVPG